METFLIKTAQLLLSLSILVLLHECGHFFLAKLFKIRVEKFSLFFDPWFHLFKFKPKKSMTEYVLGWLPLGGYVKIAGMIDESMDTEQLKKPAQPWEFRSHPAWQRLLVMLGGVIVNFLLALFIYSMILFAWGDSYIPVQKMYKGMKFNQSAQQIGFRDGDVLLRTNEHTFDRFNADLLRDIANARTVTVERNGKEVAVTMPAGMSLLKMIKEDPVFVQPLMPNVVDSLANGSPAMKAGIIPGDSILSVNGIPIHTFNEVEDALARISEQTVVRTDTRKILGFINRDIKVYCSPQDSLRLRNVSVVISRNSVRDTLKMQLNKDFTMGIVVKMPYKPETLHYSFFGSFPAGVKHGMEVLGGYVNDLKYLFTSDGAKSLGGFGAIGSIFPTTWDWPRFWEMTAFLSIVLAFMNILPIPALDGGHVLFLLYEILFRRKPGDKFMERAQVVGMTLLLILMLWANLNDVIRFLL